MDNCLSNIDLTINDGEFVLLCGGSGCGKTTLTRLINGLIPNYYEGNLEGRVTVEGLDVSRVPLYDMAGIVGSVFQNPRSQFFNVDTTGELAFGCENMGLPVEEIHTRLDRTVNELGLKHLLERNIFALSGGEKQKIACGSVAALEPGIYVLDEPSSNLDAHGIEELRSLLARWKAQGRTIVIAEHRLYYLHKLADRVIYMKDGQIERQYSGKEFSAMGTMELESMGLRVLSLETLQKSTGLPVENKGVIKLSNFSFSYTRQLNTLDVQEVEIPEGVAVAVIGQNGAGKSTFARCICGLEKKCRGQAKLNSMSLSKKLRLKACYMVMQDVNHQLFTESVLDEVLISMEQENQEHAEKILSGLDLLQLKDVHPMSLSGGQKQRVAIASAVASERQIIVFDEPTSGLDLKHMREVAMNLRQLVDMGKSVFVITHDPEFILSCCTHFLQMEKGKIVENKPLGEHGTERMLGYFLNISEGGEEPAGMGVKEVQADVSG